ncbi:endonuclease SmrB [Candidatus Fukatsuia symbiotica]|uniref:endonuclease SmrB n=1 Tax=Candidatus Fukatsuia TaxID=1927833 RepID=UPI000934DEDE|nr:endonuclease SmrB [Candidatus Fukatsuia symbiotica]MEA9445750.1 endonuclease SmrB [Candidatus Fukatsuia symbiotica]
MKKKYQLSDEEQQLFKTSIVGTKKLKQDTFVHHYQPRKQQQKQPIHLLQQQIATHYYFSDEYQPQLDNEGPTRYIRQDTAHFEIKKLRRGDYSPDIFLDLHGLTQRQAKQELAAMIVVCKHEHIHCASVMHGHGKHILKQQIPLWLAQHPDVLAFHQAPKKWGGSAALLVLIASEE